MCINGDKISGATDLTLIGLNNQAKVEGIKNIDNNAKVKFIAVEDEKTTLMCNSLDGQIFNVNDWNEFDRWYGETKKDLKIERIKCFRFSIKIKSSNYNVPLPFLQKPLKYYKNIYIYSKLC